MGCRLNSKVGIELKRKSSYVNTYLVTVQGGMELKYCHSSARAAGTEKPTDCET